MDNRFGWWLWGLLTRSRRVCPANAHGALIWRTKPLREVLVDDMCRRDAQENGLCWCNSLRAPCPPHIEGCGPGRNMLAYPSLACPACDWLAERMEANGG